MAKRNSMENRLKQEKEKEYLSKRKKLRLFTLGTLLMTLVIILLMMSDWIAIYNVDTGKNEAAVSGFNSVSSGLSGNYSSLDKAKFGEMSVFSAYAESITHKVCIITVVVLFVLIVHAVIAFFGLITNKQGAFNIIDIIFIIAEATLFIVIHSLALSAKNTDIITEFCGNPACVVQSHAILPGVFAIISLALPIVALILDRRIKPKEDPEEEKVIAAPSPKRGKKHR